VFLAGVIVYWVAGHRLSAAGFPEYALARRILSLTIPAAMLGVGLALPRYVAMAAARDGAAAPQAYLYIALALVVPLVLLIASAANAAPGHVATLLFGDPGAAVLVRPLTVLLVGLCVHSICYAYLRGRLRMSTANVLVVVNQAAVPLAALAVGGRVVSHVLWWMGSVTLATSAAALAVICHGEKGPVGALMTARRDVCAYGLPRVPGDFAIAALLGVPAVVVAHVAGLAEAGLVALGLTVVGLAAAAAEPVSVVLLPYTARALAARRYQEVRDRTRAVGVTMAWIAVVLGALLWATMTQVLSWYTGVNAAQTVPAIRVMALGIPPYLLYATMRGVNDAAYVRPINAYSAYVALIVLVAGLAISVASAAGTTGVLMAHVVSLYILGALTVSAALSAVGRLPVSGGGSHLPS